MRVFLIILWVAMILVLTCTSSFTDLITYGQIQFKFIHQPDFSNLLEQLPAELNSRFIMQKAGHILTFFVLALLLQTKLKSKLLTLFTAFSISVLTELLQLFFGRDGRIFDIGFDTIGILFALAIGTLFTPVNHNRQPIKRVP